MSLSDTLAENDTLLSLYDVREAVKELKEDFEKLETHIIHSIDDCENCGERVEIFKKKIDEIFGEKLT